MKYLAAILYGLVDLILTFAWLGPFGAVWAIGIGCCVIAVLDSSLPSMARKALVAMLFFANLACVPLLVVAGAAATFAPVVLIVCGGVFIAATAVILWWRRNDDDVLPTLVD